jgi:hypothetical protein
VPSCTRRKAEAFLFLTLIHVRARPDLYGAVNAFDDCLVLAGTSTVHIDSRLLNTGMPPSSRTTSWAFSVKIKSMNL